MATAINKILDFWLVETVLAITSWKITIETRLVWSIGMLIKSSLWVNYNISFNEDGDCYNQNAGFWLVETVLAITLFIEKHRDF